MIAVTTFFEKISYRQIVAALEAAMADNFEEFTADQTRFQESIASLEDAPEKGATPSASDVVDAIYQQIGSSLLFSCFLGLKANLDHFMDPVSRTFLDVDPEIYLREDMAKRFPDYIQAQQVQDQFYAALSSGQQHEDITAYTSHLETVGPKLAHYYGYVLGNQLFPHVIPGYVADPQLTLRYRHTLEEYLGVRIQ